MSESPGKVIADALAGDETLITPLGAVQVSTTGSTTLVLSIPAATARGLDLEQGDQFQVGHLGSEDAFVYVPANDFDGW